MQLCVRTSCALAMALACSLFLSGPGTGAHAGTYAPFQNGALAAPTLPSGGQGFDTLAPGSGAITGWTVIKGSVDYITSYFGALAARSPSVDLDGTPISGSAAGTIGGISQIFATTSGDVYTVSFSLAANSTCAPAVKDLEALVSGPSVISSKSVLFTTSTSAYGSPWDSDSLTFTAKADHTGLSFISMDPTGGVCGPVIANIAVLDTTTPVTPVGATPELPSGALAGLAVMLVAGGAWFSRRRSRNA